MRRKILKRLLLGACVLYMAPSVWYTNAGLESWVMTCAEMQKLLFGTQDDCAVQCVDVPVAQEEVEDSATEVIPEVSLPIVSKDELYVVTCREVWWEAMTKARRIHSFANSLENPQLTIVVNPKQQKVVHILIQEEGQVDKFKLVHVKNVTWAIEKKADAASVAMQ